MGISYNGSIYIGLKETVCKKISYVKLTEAGDFGNVVLVRFPLCPHGKIR